jgi:hypothetical protein
VPQFVSENAVAMAIVGAPTSMTVTLGYALVKLAFLQRILHRFLFSASRRERTYPNQPSREET